MSEINKTQSIQPANTTPLQSERQSSAFQQKLKDGKDKAARSNDAGNQPRNEANKEASGSQEAAATRSRGRPKLAEGEAKVRISMMMDPQTLDYLKSLGPGYQTLANALLGESLPGKKLEAFTIELAEEIRSSKDK